MIKSASYKILEIWFSCVCVNIDFSLSLIQLTQRLGAVHSQQVDVIQRNLTPSLAIPPLDSFSSLVESRKISFVMFIDYFLMLLLGGTHRSLLMIFLHF